MKTITEKLNGILKIVMMVFIAAMFSVIIANVFCRYVLNASLTWSAEVSRYCMVWAAYFGAAVLVNNGEHLAVDLLEKSIEGPLSKALQTVIVVGSTVLFFIMVYFGSKLVYFAGGQVAASIRFLPMSVVYAVIPISGLIMLYGAGYRLYLIFTGRDAR